jgi:hypothetical protein
VALDPSSSRRATSPTAHRSSARRGHTRDAASRSDLHSGAESLSGSSSTGSTRARQGANGSPGNLRRPGPPGDGKRAGIHLPSWRAHRNYVRARRQRRRQLRSQRPTFAGRHSVAFGSLVVLLLLLPIWISLGSAMSNPALGGDLSARLAEWSRDHGAGGVVTWIENLYYSHHAPPVGGSPAADDLPSGTARGHRPIVVVSDRVRRGATAAPAALVPFPKHPLAGEGKWVPAGRLVDGMAAVYTTFMRPDAIHTTVVDGVAWIDTRLVSARLYSGSYVPGGGPYKFNTPLPVSAESTLVAAFNGGFRLSDSQGGYFTQGVMVRPLVVGAASFVIYKNGTATVGAWGREVKMASNVAAVRQNLSLLVDHGRLAPGLASNERSQWGTVIGNSIFVSRSGVGVTKEGALVYVGGPDLDAVDLAHLLVRAGAIRGMELDINSEWVNFATFDPASPKGLATLGSARDLLPATDMSGAYRYFASYWERDFFTMSTRSTPLG